MGSSLNQFSDTVQELDFSHHFHHCSGFLIGFVQLSKDHSMKNTLGVSYFYTIVKVEIKV